MATQEEIREALSPWAKKLYQSKHRWGDWNSLCEEEKTKYIGIIESLFTSESRMARALCLYALIHSDFEQVFWNFLKPFRKLTLFILGRKNE